MGPGFPDDDAPVQPDKPLEKRPHQGIAQRVPDGEHEGDHLTERDWHEPNRSARKHR